MRDVPIGRSGSGDTGRKPREDERVGCPDAGKYSKDKTYEPERVIDTRKPDGTVVPQDILKKHTHKSWFGGRTDECPWSGLPVPVKIVPVPKQHNPNPEPGNVPHSTTD